MNIDKVLNILFRRRETKRSAVLGSRHESRAIAQTVDAGRLHDILRSAEAGDMRDFFSVARDVVAGHGHTLAEFGKRKLAVLAETQSITAANAKDEVEKAIASMIDNHVSEMTTWLPSMAHLLDSTIYPVSVVEKFYKMSDKPGWRFELDELRPVPYRLLDFTTGHLRIHDTDENGALLGTTHEPDPMRYVVHRGHLLTSTPDTWGGPLRAILFWWLFAVMDRDWWARYLERFGAPFLKGKYDKGDDTSRYLLERAFSSATRLFGIAVPDGAEVDMIAANTSQGGDAFEKFHGTANREISKIVLGQTLSAEGQNLGLGGGQASAQAEVRKDIRQFDAAMLAATVRTQILAPLCRMNGWLVSAPRIFWGGEVDITPEMLKALREAGLDFTDEAIETLSKRLGVTLVRGQAPGESPLGRLSALAVPMRGRAPASRSQLMRDATDAIAARTAPTLSKAMADTLAPLAALVGEATSLADLEARLRAAMPTLNYAEAAAIAESALVACSANAAENFREV